MFRKALIITMLLVGVCAAERKLTTNEATIIAIGPIVDFEDGVTPENSLTVTAITIELIREYDSGAEATLVTFSPTAEGVGTNDMWLVDSGGSSTIGMYNLELTATQLNFQGYLTVIWKDDDVITTDWRHFVVSNANTTDADYGNDTLQADVAQWNNTNVATPDTAGYPKVTIKDGTGTGEIDTDSGTVLLRSATETQIDAIETDTSTTLDDLVDDLETRLTAARAGYLDALNGHTAQTGDNYARLGAPAGASVSADIAAINSKTTNLPTDPADDSDIDAALLAIDNFVDDLETRLTAARAGYIDNLNGHTAQTGDNYARLGAPAGASVSADIATAQSDLNTITGSDGVTLATTQPNYAPAKAGDAMDLIADAIDSSSLAATATAEFWAEAMSDLAAGAPSATCSALTALNYIYEAWRNKTKTNSSTNEITLYKDDGSTPLVESDISDDDIAFTKGEYGAPD